MKRILQIANVANQEFSFGANRHEVFVTLCSVYNLICATVSIDDSVICCGVKCIPNTPILPKSAENVVNGSLYFETDGDYPNYANVGTEACRLVFEERDEQS